MVLNLNVTDKKSAAPGAVNTKGGGGSVGPQFDPSKYPLAVVSVFYQIVSDSGNRALRKLKGIIFDAE